MYKKLLSALLLMGSGVAAYAQPTLTASNFNPVAGDKFIIHECSTTGVTPGTAGANQTWNFTTLTTTAIDTGLVKACTAVTPTCASFLPSPATPNLAQTVPSPLKVIDYINAGTDSMVQWGYYQSADTFLKLTDPMTTMKYPFTFGTTFVDSFKGSYKFGSTLPTFMERGEITVTCDAWGVLQLPGRTDTTLRVHMHQVHRDSAHIFTIDTVATMTFDEYAWYKPGYHTALLLISTGTLALGSGAPTTLWNIVAYAPRDITGVADIKTQAASIHIYPNPSRGSINLKWTDMEAGNADVAVTDITGRQVFGRNMNFSSAGELQINLPEAPSGIYFVSVKSANVNFNGKISIEK